MASAKDWFTSLFNRGLDLTKMKVTLRIAERDRQKNFAEIRKQDARQNQLISDMKSARKLGNNLQVDYLYEELKQVKHEMALTHRVARIANRQTILLKRAIYAFERRAKSKDKNSIQGMIERLSQAGLDRMIASTSVSDEEYVAQLDELLGTTEFDETAFETDSMDEGKSRLLAELDAINAAEDQGNFEVAVEREKEIKRMLEQDDKAK